MKGRNKDMNQMYIAPTYKCNNKCLMCGVFNSKKESDWEYSKEEILEQINKENLGKEDIVIVSGGEPTLYKYFFEMINYINKKGARVTIFSNGRAFKNNNFVEKFCNIQYENILIPLFGSKKEIHDTFTDSQGSFDDTFQGLKNLDQKELDYTIKTVVMKSNYQDLSEWAYFIVKNFKKPKMVSIHGLHLQGEAPKMSEQLYVPHDVAAPYVQKAMDILIENGINVAISAFPICVIDPYYWKYNIVSDIASYKPISEDAKEIMETNQINYRTKPKECRECHFKKRCEWPWKMYEKLYSLDYLKAL